MNATAERVVTTPQLNDSMANALEIASATTLILADMGIRVIAAMANGRQPLLMVERLPESVPSVIKRQHPNGKGGMTYVRAAHFHGCQLEYMFDRDPATTTNNASVVLFDRGPETAGEVSRG